MNRSKGIRIICGILLGSCLACVCSLPLESSPRTSAKPVNGLELTVVPEPPETSVPAQFRRERFRSLELKVLTLVRALACVAAVLLIAGTAVQAQNTVFVAAFLICGPPGLRTAGSWAKNKSELLGKPAFGSSWQPILRLNWLPGEVRSAGASPRRWMALWPP